MADKQAGDAGAPRCANTIMNALPSRDLLFNQTEMQCDGTHHPDTSVKITNPKEKVKHG
jgi:hypothetical protein